MYRDCDRIKTRVDKAGGPKVTSALEADAQSGFRGLNRTWLTAETITVAWFECLVPS